MNRYRAFRFRIYPNREQGIQFAKTFGCCRFIYNHMLAERIRAWKEEGKTVRPTPAGYKEEYPWLKEVDSLALANAQLHLESAFRNFFRNKDSGYPKFHAKHHGRACYTTNVVNGNIRIIGGRLKLPKTSPVRIVLHRDLPEDARLKSVTVSREPSGKYFASLLYEYSACESQTAICMHPEKVLGIDFTMSGLAVFSDGTRAGYPMYYRRAQEKLAGEQRRLSRCRKGSKNYGKQRQKVARCHEKVRNQRMDYQDKLISRLVSEYDAICVEDLDMKAMSRGLHFGKSVMDNANGRFQRRLSEKCSSMGKAFVKVGRFFPSSKRCSRCKRVKKMLPLSERVYRCECGYREDRDINAAINIREEGKRILGCA